MLTSSLVFDPTEPDDSSNIGAYVRMFDNGKLVSYSNLTDAAGATFDFVDGDVTVGTDTIAEAAHGYETGDIVQLTTTGTLPAGLALVTDYYVIRTGTGTLKLASSLANAEAGIAVDITAAAGGGTHTATNQEREHNAMDVNIVNTLDIRDLDAAQDSIESWTHDGTGNAITSTGGYLDVNIAASSGLGIYAEDSVHTPADLGQFVFSLRVDDLTAVPAGVLAGTEGDYQAFITDASGALYVAGTDFDIRDLTSASDSVAAWLSDGAGNAIGSTAGSLDVNVTNTIDLDDDLADTAIENESTAVSVAAIDVVASALSGRKHLYIANQGNKLLFFGKTGVTVANGFPLYPREKMAARIGPSVTPQIIGSAGSSSEDLRAMQLS